MGILLHFPKAEKAVIRRRVTRLKVKNGGYVNVEVTEAEVIAPGALIDPGKYQLLSESAALQELQEP